MLGLTSKGLDSSSSLPISRTAGITSSPKIRHVLEYLRPGSIFFWDGDGAMTHEDSMRSLRLMGEEVIPAVRGQIMNPRLPFYQRMLIAAGFPEASQGTWSDAMIDAVVLWGDETRVAERIRELFSFGAAEVLVSPIGATEDLGESIHRTTRLLAELSRSPV